MRLKPKFNFQFSIGKKITISFVTLIIVIVFNGLYTTLTLNNSTEVLNVISNRVNPTLKTIDDFKTLVKDARTYSTNWVYVSRYDKDKKKLQLLHSESFPALKNKLQNLSDSSFTEEEIIIYNDLITSFEGIITDQVTIMESLDNALAYEDAMTLFICEDLIESNIIPTSDAIIDQLEEQIKVKDAHSEELKTELLGSFGDLRATIIILGLVGAVFALLISYFLSQNITVPINTLQQKIDQLRLGIIPSGMIVKNKDEIGEMSKGINALIDAFKSSSEFAKSIGNGDLEADFQAMSDEDALGHALLSMRNNLKQVINETNEVVQAAGEQGKLSSHIEIQNKQGAWHDLSVSINNLLESVATPLLEINQIVTAMAGGDLTQRYNGKANGDIFTLTSNLNTASKNLGDLLNRIAGSANIVDASSLEMLNASIEMTSNTGEIASAIAQMSAGAQNQVNKVDEASTLVEQILHFSAEMGGKASNIKEAARVGVDSSERGKEMIDNVAVSMTEISTYTEKTTGSIQVLAERSTEITRVLSVITDIASQTNLLALNAAIEAAQAGDAGRGFAVVAEEIRKLAEDSKNSAQEIEKLVQAVKTDTDQATEMMQTMNKSVKAGDEASKSASASFIEITESNSKTLTLSEDIENATKSQQNDMNKVVSITESIVVIAEQTASGTEEVASSASELSAGMENYNSKTQELTDLASTLKQEIKKFNLDDSSMQIAS
ncbi:MAG: methyl-accepting chemotaxis protein [Reichenbachiella sp.]